MSPDAGPARICELGGSRVGTKLVTITDPLLVPLLNASVRQPGGEFEGANGRGSGSDSEAAFVSDCQSGQVGFFAQRRDDSYSDLPTDMRGMLARYADAQAESIGCAPPRMETEAGGD
ncbi:hypothetical protein [Streptomyces oceani]|nr:hypothetical protein [Streptomyces oceani]